MLLDNTQVRKNKMTHHPRYLSTTCTKLNISEFCYRPTLTMPTFIQRQPSMSLRWGGEYTMSQVSAIERVLLKGDSHVV